MGGPVRPASIPVALVCLAALLPLFPARVASVAREVKGGSGTITPSGRVGPLVVGSSPVAAVRRVAGPPNRVLSAPGGPPQHASLWWNYGCNDTGCTTEYGFSRRRLIAFITRSRAFRTLRGTRVGMTRAEAERREGRVATSRCAGLPAIEVGPRRMRIIVDARGYVSALEIGAVPC